MAAMVDTLRCAPPPSTIKPSQPFSHPPQSVDFRPIHSSSWIVGSKTKNSVLLPGLWEGRQLFSVLQLVNFYPTALGVRSISQTRSPMCAFFLLVKSRPYFTLLLVLCVLYPFLILSLSRSAPHLAETHSVVLLPSQTMRHIPAKSLHVSTPTWWLESRFHFNFADYYNRANEEFGVLRVLNDDLVKPKAGFGTHPHRDMEIFTYIVDGKLTHKDSIGTSETLGRGSVQYMSAGTGIRHSEMNNNDDLLRFLQIWIKPDRYGLKPNYGSRVFKKADRHNKIQHILTDFKRYESETDLGQGVIPIHQDCNMYVSEADPGVDQAFVLHKKRQAYVVCIEGKLSVRNSVHLDARDAVEIQAGTAEDLRLQFKADNDLGAHFLVIEMALA